MIDRFKDLPCTYRITRPWTPSSKGHHIVASLAQSASQAQATPPSIRPTTLFPSVPRALFASNWPLRLSPQADTTTISP